MERYTRYSLELHCLIILEATTNIHAACRIANIGTLLGFQRLLEPTSYISSIHKC